MIDLMFLRRVTVTVVLVAVPLMFAACSAPVEETADAAENDVKESEAVEEITKLEGDDLMPGWASRVRSPEQVRDAFVFIKIHPGPTQPIWLLAPQGVGVCKSASELCGDTVTWRWLPRIIQDGSLTIEGKEGQPDCFEPIVLTSTQPVTAQVNQDPGVCPAGTTWMYQVTCNEPAGGGDCPAQPLDPQVHIQG